MTAGAGSVWRRLRGAPKAIADAAREHLAEADRAIEASIEAMLQPLLEPGEATRLAVCEKRRVPRGHDLGELALIGTIAVVAASVSSDGDLEGLDGGQGSMHCGMWLTDRRLLALGYRLGPVLRDGKHVWSAHRCAGRPYPLSALPDVRVRRGVATVALNLGEPAVPAFEVLFFRHQRAAIAAAEELAAEVQRLRVERVATPYR